jgi:Bacteriophage lambda head decoration protein D
MEFAPELAYCREAVTFNGLAGDLKIGTVLGKVTATGKYKVAVQSAVDGSAVFAGILMEDKTVAATTDTKVLVMTRGPASVSKAALVWDATYDLDAEKLVVTDAMEAKGIQVLDAS